MKATARYSDYIGTSAADLRDIDSSELSDFLSKEGVDTERYQPVGARFYAGHDYGDGFHAAIICIDKSVASEEKLIQIMLDETAESFIRLFKRLEVVFFKAYTDYEGMPASEVNISDLTKNKLN